MRSDNGQPQTPAAPGESLTDPVLAVGADRRRFAWPAIVIEPSPLKSFAVGSSGVCWESVFSA